MSSGLIVDVSVEQGRIPVTVIHLKGEVNTNTYDQLQIQADKAYANGMRNMVLDLQDVPYISSAGLRALHHIFTLLRSNTPAETDEAMSKGLRDGTFKSPHLKLAAPNAAVRELLKVSGFDMYLDIHRDVTEAVASF
jgi:ABC-type transporter Mla MlaB component